MAVWRFNQGWAKFGLPGGAFRAFAARFLTCVVASLCACCGLAVPHTFTYVADSGTTSVNLAGTFNGWNKESTPMNRGADGKTWTIIVDLAPGRIEYKFVVNGSTWITDPNATNAGDGNGNTNSVLLILPADYEHPAAKGDGVIAASALKHSGEEPDLNFDRGKLQIALRARPNDIASIKLYVAGRAATPMQEAGEDELYARYRVEIPWDRKGVLSYNFLLQDGPRAVYFGPKGLTDEPTGNLYTIDASTYQPLEVPTWVEHAVIYQIFPDRFANGSRENDPPGAAPWNTTRLTYSTWLGGDLAGVRQHLGHLAGLGISCVYFNPLFESPSYHGYETTDYRRIGKSFGTNIEFDGLTKAMKAAGIRTILDGVFNHTSVDFPMFADVVRDGAASPYTHWYTFKSFPVKLGAQHNYVAWFDFPSMPKLNHANPDVRNYLFNVPKYWDAQADIAGWRLDAANEVPDEFWRGFRTAVKQVRKDDWIVGEVWGDATHWLKGDMWDSVMNYPFLFATTAFVGPQSDGKASAYMDKLFANYSMYAPQVSRNLMNLVDSHDTPRILNACGGQRDLADLAAILEFAWVGVPTIYYGDELGMDGGKDPDNRRGTNWSLATDSNPTLSLYRRLIAARRGSQELQSGDPVRLLVDDANQVVAFGRVLDGKSAVCAVNRSGQRQDIVIRLEATTAGSQLYDAVSGTSVRVGSDGVLRLRLGARSGMLLTPEQTHPISRSLTESQAPRFRRSVSLSG